MTKSAKILREARALIDAPEKWTVLTFKTHDGCRRCMLGALLDAAGVNFWERHKVVHTPLYRALSQAIDDPRSIADWNDAPERTHAEVLAAFDRAIEIAEKEYE